MVTTLGANWYKATVLCHSFFGNTIVRTGEIRPLVFLSGTEDDIRRWESTITQVIVGKEFDSFCKVWTDRKIVPIVIALGFKLNGDDKPSTMKEVGECFFWTVGSN